MSTTTAALVFLRLVEMVTTVYLIAALMLLAADLRVRYWKWRVRRERARLRVNLAQLFELRARTFDGTCVVGVMKRS